MNFIKAIQHATIGYGIRRKAWTERENCWLYLTDTNPYVYGTDVGPFLCWAEGNAVDRPVRLCPDKPDLAVDILPEDILATDWETL